MPSGPSRSGPVGQRARRRRAPAAEVRARDTSALSGAPATDHPLLELQHAVGNAVVARLIAQRQAPGAFPSRPYPIHNGKVTVTPGAILNMRGVQVQQLPFPSKSHEATFDATTLSKGDKGTVQYLVDLEWDFKPQDPGKLPVNVVPDPLSNNLHGSAFIDVNVPFAVPTPDEGKKPQIQWLQPRFLKQESNGKGALLTIPVPVATDVTEDGGVVTINPSLAITEQLALQLGVSGTSPATPAGIATVSGGQQVQGQASDTGAYSESYSASLKVQPPDAPPAPKTFAHTVHFKVDSDQVVEGEEDPELSTWAANDDTTVTQTPKGEPVLPKSAQDAIANGTVPVKVKGKASVTGPKGKKGSYNRKLSRRRADNVQKILADLLGSGTKFQTSAVGKYQAKKTKGEEPEERIVEIEVKAVVADETTSAAAPKSGATP